MLVYDCLYDALDFTVAKLGLRLAFKLRLSDLDVDYRRQTLTDVVTGQREALSL